ncbi:hypothetical protein M422DRAFT_34476 [Sphaerobolus stellatus SS14]|uniref:Unplaced genomic scaffold SPHSTscaffold_108, whole genome shotgun sequence n=1 Tax=Sphaerobolus stellatus (strain SS14) TaxID=990650 RepID=A0A0C9V2T4_SPHS4|nr:hypothetical protein M422DRAFT_34476 [Sphaerobolus stellatus SS14]
MQRSPLNSYQFSVSVVPPCFDHLSTFTGIPCLLFRGSYRGNRFSAHQLPLPAITAE